MNIKLVKLMFDISFSDANLYSDAQRKTKRYLPFPKSVEVKVGVSIGSALRLVVASLHRHKRRV